MLGFAKPGYARLGQAVVVVVVVVVVVQSQLFVYLFTASR